MATSPPESMHALDVDALKVDDIRFWTAWQGRELAGCAAMRHLSRDTGEIKSMHTVEAMRGQGIGDRMVTFLQREAASRGYRKLNLETGSMTEFAAARRLYARHGFVECGAFSDYNPDDPLSTFMTCDVVSGPDRIRFQRIALGDVGSTNDEARQRLDQVAASPIAVTGARQLSGRGRRGRNWVSPAGNLYNSFAFIPSPPLNRLPELSFVAALAVCDMARSFVADPDKVTVKWPNDVLHDGAKLSGILLETAQTPDGQHAVIIGIGINIASAPADTPYPAACLIDHSPSVNVDLAYESLSARLGDWSARWQVDGFEPIRAAWLDRVDGLGQPLIARLPDRETHGRFAGLAEDGALMLETEGGAVLRIAAGDVFRPQNT